MSISLCYRWLLTSLCLLFAFQDFGQPYYNQNPQFLKVNGTWVFGRRAGLNFNAGGPVFFPTLIRSDEGCASVASPATGNLLFYSDGKVCRNASNQIMPEGDSLMAGIDNQTTTAQGVCIVPVIDSPGKYYLFCLNYQGNTPSLFYSIVDTSLDSGQGDIVPGRKAIQLGTDTLGESMIAIPGANCDVWLMVHAFSRARFIAYHITRDGLDTIPVVSNTGSGVQAITAYMQGISAISPDRRLLVTTSFDQTCIGTPPSGTWGTVLAEFDPATGNVSNGITLLRDTFISYGVCFSPDNSKLYVNSLNPSHTLNTTYQLDVSIFDSATIAGSVTNIYSYTPAPGVPAIRSLKLYNDTVYLASPLNQSIDRINHPNLPGAACGYQSQAIPLMGNSSSMAGLSNDVIYPLPPDTLQGKLLDTLICTENHSGFSVTLNALPGYYGYAWDDSSTGTSRVVTEPGAYWVLAKDSCHSRIDTFIIRHTDITFSLGNDTLLCDTFALLKLHVPVPGTYLWQDGSGGSSYMAKGNGRYWVTVSDNGCNAADTIQIVAKSFKQDLGPDTILCKEASFTIVLSANAPAGSTVTWNTGSQANTIAVQDTGFYSVTVTEPPCSGSDGIHITAEVCDCHFLVPNAFSPNNDGLNDVLKPGIASGCSVGAFMLSIYNRFGQRVFSSQSPDKGWDGTFNGTPADVGTYFFELSFQGGRDHKDYYQKGDITLIR